MTERRKPTRFNSGRVFSVNHQREVMNMENTARKITVPEITVVTPAGLTDRQIDNRMKRIQDLDAEIKRLQSERDDLRDQVAAAVTGERSTAHFTVRNQEVTSQKFDSKAFKADHPKMYADYCKAVTSFRFTYKAI